MDMQGFGTVIGIEQNQGVVIDAQFFDQVKSLPNDRVELKNKIATSTRFGFTSKIRSRQNGSVGNLS